MRVSLWSFDFAIGFSLSIEGQRRREDNKLSVVYDVKGVVGSVAVIFCGQNVYTNKAEPKYCK